MTGSRPLLATLALVPVATPVAAANGGSARFSFGGDLTATSAILWGRANRSTAVLEHATGACATV